MANSMNPDQMVAFMRRLVKEVQQDGNFDLTPEFIHPEFFNHTAPPGMAKGIAGVRAMLEHLHTVFADIKVDIKQSVAQGNVIATNKTLTGRQMKDWQDTPASGKMVQLDVMDFVTIEDGKIKEHWAQTSRLKIIEE